MRTPEPPPETNRLGFISYVAGTAEPFLVATADGLRPFGACGLCSAVVSDPRVHAEDHWERREHARQAPTPT